MFQDVYKMIVWCYCPLLRRHTYKESNNQSMINRRNCDFSSDYRPLETINYHDTTDLQVKINTYHKKIKKEKKKNFIKWQLKMAIEEAALTS